MRLVMRCGTVVDGQGIRRADVAIEGNTVSAVGEIIVGPDSHAIDCRGHYVLPGFVDTHSHADGLMEDEPIQRYLLIQGVAMAIAGQDGVSHAPGDGGYACEYFAAIDGRHPSYSGGDAECLAAIDGRARLNLARLGLPPELSVLPADAAVEVTTDPAERRRLRRDRFPTVERNASLGPECPSMITRAHVAAPEFAWAHGLTLMDAAARAAPTSSISPWMCWPPPACKSMPSWRFGTSAQSPNSPASSRIRATWAAQIASSSAHIRIRVPAGPSPDTCASMCAKRRNGHGRMR